MKNLIEQLQTILDQANAATEGPWIPSGRYVEKHYRIYGHNVAVTPNEENANFIASSRTNIPALTKALMEAVVCLEEVSKSTTEVVGNEGVYKFKTYAAEIAAGSLSEIERIMEGEK